MMEGTPVRIVVMMRTKPAIAVSLPNSAKNIPVSTENAQKETIPTIISVPIIALLKSHWVPSTPTGAGRDKETSGFK